MIVSTFQMNAGQFLQLGEDPPGVRLELVQGEVAVSPSITPGHSLIDTALRFILEQHIRAGKLGILFGDVSVILGPHDVRRPDLLYFSAARLHLVGKTAMQGPPDLCVEIISPGSNVVDRRDKFAQYRDFGVAHYWIVDPPVRTLEAYKLVDREYRLAASGRDDQQIALPPFDDLLIPLAELWRPVNRLD